MRNFMMGIAMLMLGMMFITFQVDIHRMQTELMFLSATANEIANTAALQYLEEDYAEGYLNFDMEKGMQNCLKVAEANLEWDMATKSSTKKYYQEGNDGEQYFHIILYFFHQQGGQIYKSIDGEQPVLLEKRWTRESYAREFIPELTDSKMILIDAPMVVCFIDAGHPSLRLSFLDELEEKTNLRRVGIYEYKDN